MYFLEENERLIDAAEIKNAKLVNQLIHYGADVNSRRDEGNGRFGHTALPEAASSGCLDAVKSLVSAGADLELTDDHFEEDPPLVRAADRGNLDIVKVLVINGAKIDGQDRDQMSALHKAFMKGWKPIIRYLLDCGANRRLKNERMMEPVDVAKDKETREEFRNLSNSVYFRFDDDMLVPWNFMQVYKLYVFTMNVHCTSQEGLNCKS